MKHDFLLDYYTPYWKIIYAIIAVTVVQVISQFLILFMVKPLIKEGATSTNFTMIIVYGLVCIGLILVFSVTAFIVSSVASKTSASIATDLRKGLFDKVVSVRNIDDLGTEPSGMMVRLMTDVSEVQKYTTNFISILIYLVMTVVATLIFSLIISLYLFVTFTVLTVIIVILAIFVGKKEYSHRRELQSLFDKVVTMFRDLVRGSRSRRLFGHLNTDQERFRSVGKLYANELDGTRLRVNLMNTILALFMGLLITAAIVVSFNIGAFTSIGMSEFIVIIQLLIIFYQALGLTPFLIESIPTVTASVERIDAVLSMDTRCPDTEAPESGSAFIVKSVTGDEPSIEFGKETSIIGVSGSGKSEYIRKILLFNEIQSGTLLFNGIDMSVLDPSSVRKKIAYAGILALTFRGTLENNICLWGDNNSRSLSEVCCAVGLNYKPDTMFDRASSATQSTDTYKISIARALMKDADLYIFDDCFSGMDIETKMSIVSNIRKMLKGKTVVFTSYDPMVFDFSENISIMNDGHLVVEGPYSDVCQHPEFRKLRFGRDIE